MVDRRTGPWAGPLPFRFKKIRRVREMVTLHLHDLLRLRLPIGDGFIRIASETFDRSLSRTLHGIGHYINRGEPIHSAFRQFPRIFPPSYIDLLRSGEEAGALDQTVGHILRHIRESNEFHTAMHRAIVYFILIQGASLFILLSLILFVVPQFREISDSFDQPLPAQTLALLALGDLVRSPWGMPGMIGLLAAAAWLIYHFRRGKLSIPNAVWDRITSLPIAGALWVKRPLADAAMIMKTMLAAGVPLTTTLEDVSLLAMDGRFRDAFARVHRNVVLGETLTAAFKAEARVFPASFVAAIAMGEAAGSMSDALGNVADSYRQDALRAGNVLNQVVAPFLVCVIGATVYFTYSGMFAAIVNLHTFVNP